MVYSVIIVAILILICRSVNRAKRTNLSLARVAQARMSNGVDYHSLSSAERMSYSAVMEIYGYIPN